MLKDDPAELAVIRQLEVRAADARHKLDDVRQAMADDVETLTAQARALQAADAAPSRIQQVERRLLTRPQTEEEARQVYLREYEEALQRARWWPETREAMPSSGATTRRAGATSWPWCCA